MCKIWSKLKIKTPERHHSGVFILAFEHVSQHFLVVLLLTITAQKMKFTIKDFFSKCDQIRRKLRIWSHLLTRSLMENFIFCAAYEQVSVCWETKSHRTVQIWKIFGTGTKKILKLMYQ